MPKVDRAESRKAEDRGYKAKERENRKEGRA